MYFIINQRGQAMSEYLIVASAILLGLSVAAFTISKKIGAKGEAKSLIDCVKKQMNPNTTAENADVFFGLSQTGPRC